ncbi:MAG: metal ABC transporter permease [Parcubacteria group bacterium]|nr:metal ABC transporter permease [Parcubacteria group bacterium]
MTITDNLGLIVLALSLGLSLPLIGVFVILRKQALLSDALAHVLLLGIALSLVLKINTAAGLFVFAMAAAVAIFFVKDKSRVNLDAVVGVFFTTSLALGSLLIPSEELLETFLGNLEKIGWTDVAVSAALAGLIIITLLGRFREFAFAAFAPDLAQVDRLKVKKYELAFMLILALGVAIGIKLIGTLLVSALIIVPAATAKIFSLQIRSMAVWSMLLGLASALIGLVYSIKLDSPPGPTIILAGSALFFLTFILHSLFKPRS